MRTRVTLQLLEEVATHQLRWVCDDCAYFVLDEERCAHGWPEVVRRGASTLRPGDTITFCKEFEGR